VYVAKVKRTQGTLVRMQRTQSRRRPGRRAATAGSSPASAASRRGQLRPTMTWGQTKQRLKNTARPPCPGNFQCGFALQGPPSTLFSPGGGLDEQQVPSPEPLVHSSCLITTAPQRSAYGDAEGRRGGGTPSRSRSAGTLSAVGNTAAASASPSQTPTQSAGSSQRASSGPCAHSTVCRVCDALVITPYMPSRTPTQSAESSQRTASGPCAHSIMTRVCECTSG